MSCFRRALCYLKRKRVRTVLLFLDLLIVTVLILGTLSSRNTTAEILMNLKENAESKVMTETQNEEAGISESQIRDVIKLPDVKRVNRLYERMASFEDLMPFEDEDENGEFKIHEQDDIEKDSPFEDKIYRLTEGSFPKNSGELLINAFLAERNGLSVGDQIGSGSVTGLFISGTERQQTDGVAAVSRIENQIYIKADGQESPDGSVLMRMAVYLKDPGKADEVTEELKEIFGNDFSFTRDDHTYLKLKQSISETDRIMKLTMRLTFALGIIVTALLLCLWMRDRKTEIAVFRSMGIPVFSVLMQALTEGFCVWLAAILAATWLVHQTIPIFSGYMQEFAENQITLALTTKEPFWVGIAGDFVLTVLIVIAVLPYLIRHPKEILSEMEG